MTVLRIRGRALPTGEWLDLYADGDRWTTDPVAGAELVGEGWLLPGLVDAHTHPGAPTPADDIDEDLLREQLHRHVEAGVTLIRSPGLAGDPPAWFGQDPDVPRAVHAGPWIAQHGHFFDGAGVRADHANLPALAATQAAKTGWAKLIADWGIDDDPVPVEVMTAIAEAVHAVGGRVAVHSQQPGGAEIAIAAGVDSVEHGMCLDLDWLPRMAAQGTALTPTLTVISRSLESVRSAPDGPRKDWYVGGAGVHGARAAAAAEAGVVLLAGTDDPTLHGRVADEVRALAAAGVPTHTALGAASWTARAYLGRPGLEPGAPADAVVYAEDPRTDLSMLDAPAAIVLRGRRVA
ncbi:MAG TPA: amidohydrolase family protein [Micromonosporaceae bacterium]|jgi:imidazolonepropionase-like amidohydrolase